MNVQLIKDTLMTPLGVPVLAGQKFATNDPVCYQLTNGYARSVAQRASSPFLFMGFAEAGVDNTNGADGDEVVRVFMRGLIWVPSITGMSGIGGTGNGVYMSAPNVFTNAPGSDPYNVKAGTLCTYSVDKPGYAVFFQNEKFATIV